MLKLTKRTERKIGEVLQKHQESLLRKSNVIGIGIGEKITNGQNTGRVALITFVERKVSTSMLAATDVIQPMIEGVEVDVIEIGRPIIQANTTRLRPAIAGISVGHVNVTAGTFGCLLRSEADGQLYLLSNNHVMANSNNGRFGDVVVQPGTLDGGMNPGDRIATLYRYPAVIQPGDNLTDCAVARPVNAADVRAVTLDGWSDVKMIPGWFGAEDQGGDVALADISGNGRQDLVVFHIDNPGGENHGYYRIGWNLDANGNVTGGWSNIKPVPGWFGAEDQGAGIAIADINGNGRPDLVVFHIDNPGGENHGYYRIGWNLDANGNVTGGWSNIKPVPGWFGAEDQEAGIAIADINGNGRPDLVVFHIDNPGGQNHGYYRIGWNLDANGNVTGSWSPVIAIPGWFGAEDQGAGIALTDLTGNGRRDLMIFHVDNPSGENHGYYRIGFDLMPSGVPAIWTIA